MGSTDSIGAYAALVSTSRPACRGSLQVRCLHAAEFQQELDHGGGAGNAGQQRKELPCGEPVSDAVLPVPTVGHP